MTHSEDRAVVRRLKRLSQIEPSRESTELAIEHARAAMTSLSFAEASRPPERASIWHQITLLLGGLTMRKRIAVIGGVGAAVVLALLLSWNGIATKPVSAMEQMAENIRQAKSWKCTAVEKVTFTFKMGDPPKVVERKEETKMTEYWRAPDSIRMESTSAAWNGTQPERTKIAPGGNKPCIMIDNRQKTFRLRAFREKDVAEMKLFSPDKLANYRGEADHDLGPKKINGKQARGFVIGTKKINPALPSPGLLEIWLDSETSLPVLIRCEVKTETMSATTESSDIQWNIDLDPKLFDATPPEGYRDLTPKPPTSGDPVGQITEALRSYARCGRYPVKQHQIGVTDWIDILLETLNSMQSMLERGEMAFQAKADSDQKKLSAKAFAQQELKRIATQREGFLHLRAIIMAGHDVAYYGSTVGPKDSGKVLLRWKLADGQYEVIFGDLRAETMTAERLRILEGK